MILLLQVWIGAAVMAWHQFGELPPLVAIPLAAYSVAFVGLWRQPGQHRVPRPDGINISQAPPHVSQPSIRGVPPRRPGTSCPDSLAELELAERFSSESG